VVLPFKYIGYDTQAKPIDYQTAEVIVFNRLAHEPPERFFANQRKFGFKYVVDVDDYWHLYPHHYIYANWQKARFTEKIEAFIKGANIVTTTHAALAIKIRPLNKNVVIIPNALPFDQDQFSAARTEAGQTRFIYAGGSSHLHDFEQVAPAIRATKGIKFTLAGIEANDQWNKMQALLQGYNYVRHSFKPIGGYMQVYNNSDVALGPLQGNVFNSLKSNLKMLEAGCKNMAFIASKVHPYLNDLDKRYVMYAETEAEWRELIGECIKDPALTREAGLQLGEHVREHYDLIKVNEIRRQVYESLL
jgi:hypothetical protein